MDQKQLSIPNNNAEVTNFNCVVLLIRCDALLNSTTTNYVNDDSVFSKNTNVSNETTKENEFRRITRKRKLLDKLVSENNDQPSNIKKQKCSINKKQCTQTIPKKPADLQKRTRKQKLVNSFKNNSTSSDLNQMLEPVSSTLLDDDTIPVQSSIKSPQILVKIPKSVIKKPLFSNLRKHGTLKKIERTGTVVSLKTAKNKTTKSYNLVKKKLKPINVNNSVASNRMKTRNIKSLKPHINKRNKPNTIVKKKNVFSCKNKNDALNKKKRSGNVLFKTPKNKTTKSNNLIEKKPKAKNVNNIDASNKIEGIDNNGPLALSINKKIKYNTPVKKKSVSSNINQDDESNEVEKTKFETSVNKTFLSNTSSKKTSTIKNENIIDSSTALKEKDNLVVYLERCHFSPNKKLLSKTDIANIFNYEADLTKDLTQYLENQINDQELKLSEKLDNDHESQLSEKLNNNQESQLSENPNSGHHELQFSEELGNNKESQLSEEVDYNTTMLRNSKYSTDRNIELMLNEDKLCKKSQNLSIEINSSVLSSSSNTCNDTNESTINVPLIQNDNDILATNNVQLIESIVVTNDIKLQHFNNKIDTNKPCSTETTNISEITFTPSTSTEISNIRLSKENNPPSVLSTHETVSNSSSLCEENLSSNMSELVNGFLSSPKIELNNYYHTEIKKVKNIQNQKCFIYPKVKIKKLQKLNANIIDSFLAKSPNDCNHMNGSILSFSSTQNDDDLSTKNIVGLIGSKVISNDVKSECTNANREIDTIEPLYTDSTSLSEINIMPSIYTEISKSVLSNKNSLPLELSSHNPIPDNSNLCEDKLSSNILEPQLNNVLSGLKTDIKHTTNICNMEVKKVQNTRKPKRSIYKKVKTKKLQQINTNTNELVLINNSSTCDDDNIRSTQKVTQNHDNIITTNSVVPLTESTVDNEINIDPCSSDTTYFSEVIMAPSTSSKVSKGVLTSENDPPSDLNLLQPKSCSSYLTSHVTSSGSSEVNHGMAILSEAVSHPSRKSVNKTVTKNSLKQNIKGTNSIQSRKKSLTLKSSKSQESTVSPQRVCSYENIARKNGSGFANEPRKTLELGSPRLYGEASVNACSQTNTEHQIFTLSKRFNIPVKALYDTVVEEPLSVFQKRYSKSVSPSMLLISPIIKNVDSKLWSSSNCVNGKLNLQYKIEPIRESAAYVKTNLKDMIEELSKTMPSWSISIVPNPSRFVISHMSINMYGVPIANKVIVLDRHFKASVYINQCLEDNYSKYYTTATEIIDLIKELSSI